MSYKGGQAGYEAWTCLSPSAAGRGEGQPGLRLQGLSHDWRTSGVHRVQPPGHDSPKPRLTAPGGSFSPPRSPPEPGQAGLGMRRHAAEDTGGGAGGEEEEALPEHPSAGLSSQASSSPFPEVSSWSPGRGKLLPLGADSGPAQPLEKSPGIDLCNLWPARYAFGNLLKATENLRIIPTYTHRPTPGLRLSALHPGDADNSRGSRGHQRQGLHDLARREKPHSQDTGGSHTARLGEEPGPHSWPPNQQRGSGRAPAPSGDPGEGGNPRPRFLPAVDKNGEADQAAARALVSPSCMASFSWHNKVASPLVNK